MEVFLLKDINSAHGKVKKIAALAKKINPDRIQINTAVRPPAEDFAAPLTRKCMLGLTKLFQPPAEMIAGEMCWTMCPGLREQQLEVIHKNLRDMTGSLAPRIREQIPSLVFDKNAAMNAAFALWWASSAEEPSCVVPFESLGFKEAGQQLLDAYAAIPAEDEMRVVKATDAWAGILEMAELYEWRAPKEQN